MLKPSNCAKKLLPRNLLAFMCIYQNTTGTKFRNTLNSVSVTKACINKSYLTFLFNFQFVRRWVLPELYIVVYASARFTSLSLSHKCSWFFLISCPRGRKTLGNASMAEIFARRRLVLIFFVVH